MDQDPNIGPYMDIFGYNNFGPFFPSVTQAANTTGTEHFWSKQPIGQPLPGNPYLSVHDTASYYSRDTYGDTFNAGVLKHVESGMGTLTLDYIKTNDHFAGQTVGAASFQPTASFQPAAPTPSFATTVTQANVSVPGPPGPPGHGSAGIGNSFDSGKRLDSINSGGVSNAGLSANHGSSNVVCQITKKPSWASVASQPAKPQPKSLKSKISGSTVLSSGKHMPPPTPPTCMDNIGTWESKNGSSMGVQSISSGVIQGSSLNSGPGHTQSSGSNRHGGSGVNVNNGSNSANPVGAINNSTGQLANQPGLPGNGPSSSSWGPSQGGGNRNVSRSANMTNSGPGYMPLTNLNSSSVRQVSGPNSMSNHHHSSQGGTVVGPGANQNNHHGHQSTVMGQHLQGHDNSANNGGATSGNNVHQHHHRDNNRYGSSGQHHNHQASSGQHQHHGGGAHHSHHHHSSSQQHSGAGMGGQHGPNHHHHHHHGGHGPSSGTGTIHHQHHGHHGQHAQHAGHHPHSHHGSGLGATGGPSAAPAVANNSVASLDNSGPSYPSHPILDKLRLENNYNPKEFDLSPKDARFFIIKSYSEDDIHRSIKYSIWCSTEHGNKRLDAAFKSQEGRGSVYLFYSVNGSGHFCGMAQMLSTVDYNSSSSVWAQDKWKGQFKVKWIYVKDVPNAQLRHIRLENNEGKPVTNSRDTQEVPYTKGKAVLKIMHSFRHTTSIFDDFLHYERRQAEEEQQRRSESDSLPPPTSSHNNNSNTNNNRDNNGNNNNSSNSSSNNNSTGNSGNHHKENHNSHRDNDNRKNNTSSHHNSSNPRGHSSNNNNNNNNSNKYARGEWDLEVWED